MSDKLSLSYNERRFLQAYHYFLGLTYEVGDVVDMHLAQNMVIFLHHIGWMHTDFEFMMAGEHGMYSPGFHAFLLKLNKKVDEVSLYQSSETYFSELSLSDWKVLGEYSDMYLLEQYQDDLLVWIETLALVTYIKHVVLGGAYFPLDVVCDRVWQEDGMIPKTFVRDAYNVV